MRQNRIMKLYLLETKGLGDYYVIAKDVLEAETILTNELDRADYGFSKDRLVIGIRLITQEVGEFPAGRPNFNDQSRLLVSETKQ